MIHRLHPHIGGEPGGRRDGELVVVGGDVVGAEVGHELELEEGRVDGVEVDDWVGGVSGGGWGLGEDGEGREEVGGRRGGKEGRRRGRNT